ncbi:MbtH family protein [Herbaspirillum sp. CF444]|uniref:MbtH family protein n=1 Tax=Herbaspirillum sp. CF444 TaxID=1144319 RepID=UPI0009D95FE1|nr:MbtH family NRPS accessory protein [Herbaspirillum sp. CF444]
MSEVGADVVCLVVVNDQRQYSVWPAQRKLPAGWRVVGEPASRESCLDRIETLWSDEYPGALRAAPDRTEPAKPRISLGDKRGDAGIGDE